jgi:DNA-binding transcriptional LysR family regulator
MATPKGPPGHQDGKIGGKGHDRARHDHDCGERQQDDPPVNASCHRRDAPDLRMAAVGAPSYFARRRPPKTPQDLAQHDCINLRFPTLGSLYAWEFEKDGREINVRVEGQVIVNDIRLARQAAVNGLGLTYLPEDYVQPLIEEGRVVRVLANWCPPFPGYHLYYPSRRQPTPAFALLLEALRHRSRK